MIRRSKQQRKIPNAYSRDSVENSSNTSSETRIVEALPPPPRANRKKATASRFSTK